MELAEINAADIKSDFSSRELKLLYKLSETYNEIKPRIDQRAKEFASVNKGSNEDWFHELCFCILTANTSAKMGYKMQEAISVKEFLSLPLEELRGKLNELRCRFYNKRSEYIYLAREHAKLKEILSNFDNSVTKRAFLAANIKGIGLKEASHFLRNTGHMDVAILDKHVKNILIEHGVVMRKKAENLNETNYFYIENKLNKFAEALGISQGELDYVLWYQKTGEVLK